MRKCGAGAEAKVKQKLNCETFTVYFRKMKLILKKLKDPQKSIFINSLLTVACNLPFYLIIFEYIYISVSILSTDTLLNCTDIMCDLIIFLIERGSYLGHRRLLFFIILLIKRIYALILRIYAICVMFSFHYYLRVYICIYKN